MDELETMEEMDAADAEIEKLEEELDELFEEVMETEMMSEEALDAFGDGIKSSSKYLKESEDFSF